MRPACAGAVLDDDLLAERFASAGATVRAVMSTFPAGGHGTTMRTGLFGKSCAAANVATSCDA